MLITTAFAKVFFFLYSFFNLQEKRQAQEKYVRECIWAFLNSNLVIAELGTLWTESFVKENIYIFGAITLSMQKAQNVSR